MKKFYFIFIILFVLFSCNNWEINKNKQEIINNEKCANNSPLKENALPKIYWAFMNKSDGKCWYLGYIDRNFFLINNDDYLAPYTTNDNTNNIEWQKWDWEYFNWSWGNILYGSYEEVMKILKNDFYITIFHEIPTFHEYFPNIKELFLKEFQENNIILPENPVKIAQWWTEDEFDTNFKEWISFTLKSDFTNEIKELSIKFGADSPLAKKAIKAEQQKEVIKNSKIWEIQISHLYEYLRN